MQALRKAGNEMKKFLIGCMAVIACGLLYMMVTQTNDFTKVFRRSDTVETFTTVKGKEIYVDTGDGMKPFEIRGVDMGVGIPGHFATDYAIDEETYLRWFEQIQEMGANCIRVYTILQEDFYDALWAYNHENDNPLYVIHGLWLNDYVLYSHRDAYHPDFLDQMIEDAQILIDVLHGHKSFSLREDLGSGNYKHDVSPWILGYILGVEWEDTTVAFTNHMKSEKNSYQGKYMYTTEDASPFEAALAQIGDKMIAYESKTYGTQRLLAFTNWPTTDPLEWEDSVVNYFRKFAKVDVEHIKTTQEYISGQFASYHIYPYFPDFLGFMDILGKKVAEKDAFTDENGVFNSYRAYLSLINDHHSMPVIISEFGVPSSRGCAQTDRNTKRNQGGMSEKEQAEALVTCYEDIIASGCAGSVIFTWQDEWFKRTWNTMAYTDLTKTPYWSDYQTNEQYFGILSFDPGEERSVSYVDGDMEEWTEEDVVTAGADGTELSVKYDEKYVYLRLHKENFNPESEVLYVPFDITPKTGSKKSNVVNLEFERDADFLLEINGKENSRLYVQKRYEAIRSINSHRVYREDAYLNVPAKDTEEFEKIMMLLQVPVDPRKEIEIKGYDLAEIYETGHLTYGNGNPEAEDFNSLADFIIEGDDVEVRLPWGLLNFSNPAECVVHDDYYEHYGIENLTISEIYAGIGTEGQTETVPMGKVELKGWGRNPTYHERLKEGYYAMQQLWTKEAVS